MEVIGDEASNRGSIDTANGKIHITNSAETIDTLEGVVVAWELYVGATHEITMIVMRPQSGNNFM